MQEFVDALPGTKATSNCEEVKAESEREVRERLRLMKRAEEKNVAMCRISLAEVDLKLGTQTKCWMPSARQTSATMVVKGRPASRTPLCRPKQLSTAVT